MASAELERAREAVADYKAKLAGVDDSDPMVALATVRGLDASVIPTWSGPLDADIEKRDINLGGISAVEVTPPGADTGRVIMYLHGGGFVLGSPETVTTPISRAARRAKARAILPRYRLAPENPFPAQVEDVVTAFLALLETGVKAENVVIAGESAGGGLVLLTLLALRDGGHPLPGGAVPISPMADFEFKGASWNDPNIGAHCFVTRELAMQNVPAFMQGQDEVAASPINHDLTGLPPLLIQVGGDEGIQDDGIAFGEKAKAAGVDVTIEVWDDMTHLWHNHCSFLPDAQQALDHIADFVTAHTQGS
ncbi:unannotated protein [freshwater metagenome]|uniref:Unannotated protein n=1 Tax=freshwater metagenome TaxID=449393 RepID=A0A6J7JE23_9ZZZZ|nr:alpha/beta hydrolase fold domain-containing protein [Actinomycetota bacterium]